VQHAGCFGHVLANMTLTTQNPASGRKWERANNRKNRKIEKQGKAFDVEEGEVVV